MTIDEIIQRALTGLAASSPEAGRTAGSGMASLEYKTVLVAPSVENVGSFASPQLRLGGGSREIQSADNRRRVSAPTQAAAEQAEREQAVALLEQGRMRFGRERVSDFAAQSRETARLVADAAAALARQEAAHARAALGTRVVGVHHFGVQHAIGAVANGNRGGAPGESINARRARAEQRQLIATCGEDAVELQVCAENSIKVEALAARCGNGALQRGE